MDIAKLKAARERSRGLRRDHAGVTVELAAEVFIYRGGALAVYQNDKEYKRMSSFEKAPEAQEVER